MTKTAKRNIIISVFTLILVSLLIWLPPQGKSKSVKNIVLKAIDKKIDRIQFKRHTNTFAIVWEGGDWKIEKKGYPVIKDKVDKLILAVEKDRNAEVVSDSSLYQPYGLDDENKLEIFFFSENNELKKITVGTSANRFGSYYGLEDNDPVIYQINFDRYHLDYEEKDLVNLKIFDFSPVDVIQLSLKDKKELVLKRSTLDNGNSTNQNFSKAESLWKDQNGNEYPKEKVNDIINTLSTLQGDKIVEIDQNKKTSPLRVLKLNLSTGQSFELIVNSKKEDNYLVSIPGRNYDYLLPNIDAEKILHRLEK